MFKKHSRGSATRVLVNWPCTIWLVTIRYIPYHYHFILRHSEISSDFHLSFRLSCFLLFLAFLFWFSICWVFRRETLLIVASPLADFLADFLPKAIRFW